MNVAVVIPVGPGHESVAGRAVRSVRRAWETTQGPFTDMDVALVADPEGLLGRSRARNRGMDTHPADWHFLLDADDQMVPEAFGRVRLDVDATFGAIWLDGALYKWDAWGADVTRDYILEHGARGTIAMGCFVRGDLGLRFDETLDQGEDFDFYMRIPSWVKLLQPLVDIGYRSPSVGRDPNRRRAGWLETCDRIIDHYRHHEHHETEKTA